MSDKGIIKPVKIGGKTAYLVTPKKEKKFKRCDIKIKIDTTGIEKFLDAFERVKVGIMEIFIKWLESEEGQEAIRQAIRKELKR